MPSLLTPEEILSNARALVPEIRRRADEIAKLRKLPSDLVEKLRAAGVFRISMPKSWGGPEMPLPQQIELMELLAEADASVSWCVKIGSDSGVFAAFMAEETARDLYPKLDLITAGQAGPVGRAIKADGGYRVSGRWSFASGCTHADVIMAGCILMDPEGRPLPPPQEGPLPPGVPRIGTVPTWVFSPASAWTIEDTWHAHGLAGSGSNHFSAKDLFIPEGRLISATAPAKWAKGPLYAATVSAALLTPMAGTPLGLTRHAIDIAIGVMRERKMPMSATPMTESARIHLALARAETAFGAARAFVYNTAHRVWNERAAGRVPSDEDVRNESFARINAFRMARDVTRLLYDTLGSAAVPQAARIECLMRDAATMNQHNLFSESVVEEMGRSLLGGAVPKL